MKQKRMSKLLLLAMCLAPVKVFAQVGEHAGNGGNGVVCYTDSSKQTISSIELFDYWEMGQVLNIPGGLNLGGNQISYPNKIKLVLERIYEYQPDKAERLKKITDQIVNHIDNYLFADSDIVPVNDDNSQLVPQAPCYKERLAIQVKNPNPGYNRFMIKKSIFNHPKATNDMRAGIILHEAIYRDAIMHGGHTNSDATRYFNYLMATQKGQAMSADEYTKVTTNLKLLYGGCRPVFVEGPNQMMSMVFTRNNYYAILCTDKVEYRNSKLSIDFYKGNRLMFYPNSSKLSSVYSDGDELNVTMKYNGSKSDSFNKSHNTWIHFHENFTVKLIDIDKKYLNASIQYGNQIIPCAVQSRQVFGFNKNAEVNFCRPVRGTVVTLPHGKATLGSEYDSQKDITAGEIRFDENWKIKSLSALSSTLEIQGQGKANLFYDIVFDSDEYPVKAYFFTPLKKRVNGVDVEVPYFTGVQNGKMVTDIRAYVPAEFNGNALSIPTESNAATIQFCRKRGFDGASQWSLLPRKLVFINGVQRFYEPATDKIVTFVDEDAWIATPDMKVECMQIIQFDL